VDFCCWDAWKREFSSEVERARWRGGATVRIGVGAILMLPRYGVGAATGWMSARGFIPKIRRMKPVRKMRPWMKEKTAPAKKETCTAAGNHQVKSSESVGRPYISPLCIKGDTAIWPFSPPFYRNVSVLL